MYVCVCEREREREGGSSAYLDLCMLLGQIGKEVIS